MTKVLLVEDSTIVAFHIKLFLEGNGFSIVKSIVRGEDVISAVIEHSPDIILMDIMLDDKMNGIEAAQLVRKDHNTPIIFMSALSDKDSIEQINAIENAVIVGKPFVDQDFLKIIRQITSIQ